MLLSCIISSSYTKCNILILGNNDHITPLLYDKVNKCFHSERKLNYMSRVKRILMSNCDYCFVADKQSSMKCCFCVSSVTQQNSLVVVCSGACCSATPQDNVCCALKISHRISHYNNYKKTVRPPLCYTYI